MMKNKKFTVQLLGVGLVVLVLIAGLMVVINTPASASATIGSAVYQGMDHSALPQLQEAFTSGPEVTAACLTCHEQQGSDVMMSTHWTWEYETEDGQTLGKNNVINNYCIAVSSNEARCTSCHIGYGNRDITTFDYEEPTNVDCLACHDTTGTYVKFPTGAGHPAYEDTVFAGNGKTYLATDLNAVAQSVGLPTRENCASCHFYGGGGAGVKHGDLDPAMKNPTLSLDVHMSPEGNDFTCQTCHVTENHQVSGSRYEMTVGEPAETLKTCVGCHTDGPHEEATLNEHLDRVACQTCHIPEYAREFQTKMWWDWSSAGEKNAEGKPFQIKDESTGWVTYDSKKGDFVWEMNVTPDYQWFNGGSTWITLDDTVSEENVAMINELHGDINDETSLIFPMKSFGGIQPYDAGTDTLAVPHLFPNASDAENPTAYWKKWDWNLSLETGQAAVGREFSGELGFVETVMYWPLTHQVAPAADAVECQSCHTAEEGRLDFAALGYSKDDVTRLTSFPPVTMADIEAAAVAEAVAAEAVVAEEVAVAEQATADAAAVEQAATDAAAVEQAATDAAAEEATAKNNTIWVSGGIALIVVLAALFFMRKKEA